MKFDANNNQFFHTISLKSALLQYFPKQLLLDKELATSQSLQPQNQSDKTENDLASNIQTTKQSKLTDYFKK